MAKPMAGCGPYLMVGPPDDGVALVSVAHPTNTSISVDTADINLVSLETFDLWEEQVELLTTGYETRVGAQLTHREGCLGAQGAAYTDNGAWFAPGPMLPYKLLSASLAQMMEMLQHSQDRATREIAAETLRSLGVQGAGSPAAHTVSTEAVNAHLEHRVTTLERERNEYRAFRDAERERNAILSREIVALRALAQETADQECVYLREITELHRRLATEDSPEAPEPRTDVDRVIDQLDRRLVGGPDRNRLRRSLDRAEAPDKSRSGQDAAVGRALGFEKQGVGMVWRP